MMKINTVADLVNFLESVPQELKVIRASSNTYDSGSVNVRVYDSDDGEFVVLIN
jgi:hypothetical protein